MPVLSKILLSSNLYIITRAYDTRRLEIAILRRMAAVKQDQDQGRTGSLIANL